MKRNPVTDECNVWAMARDFLHAYMPKTRRLSPQTIQAYRISLECFLRYLADEEHVDRAEVSFEHFGRDHLKRWVTWMNIERNYAPRTVALRLTAVTVFLGYAAAEDVTLVALHQSAKTLKAPAPPRTPIDYLTGEQLQAVLAAHTGTTAKSRRNRMLLILLYETAARVSEITGLMRHDLQTVSPAQVRLTGKGNKTRVVPLSDKTIEHLQVYLGEFHPGKAGAGAAGLPLFYSSHNGTPAPLSVDTVAAVVKAAASIAREACPTVPARVYCHMLRKTKAMDLYQHGIPLPIIMRLLGHENASTTQAFYAFATLDMMREAINAATPTAEPEGTQRFIQDHIDELYSLR